MRVNLLLCEPASGKPRAADQRIKSINKMGKRL